VESKPRQFQEESINEMGKPYALFVSAGLALKICDLSSTRIDKAETGVHFSGFIQVIELLRRLAHIKKAVYSPSDNHPELLMNCRWRKA
jgi:hypothetical protein